MKKIANMFGALAAVLLLSALVGCNSAFDVTLKSPEIVANDPVFTGRSVKLSWKPTAGYVAISRQEVAEGSEEVFLPIAQGSVYYDRISLSNELKAGTYKYRFYNVDGDVVTGDVTSRAAAASTIKKEYSCVEKEITIEDEKIVKKGTKLEPFTENDVKVEEIEGEDGNVTVYVSVNKEEAFYELYVNDSITLENHFTYNIYNDTYVISVKKTWGDGYYLASDTYEVGARKEIEVRLSYPSDDTIAIEWTGKAGIEYNDLVFTTVDNQTNYKDIEFKAEKVTSDENDHYIALIKKKDLYKAIGIDLDAWEKYDGEDASKKPATTKVRAVKVTVSGKDAEGKEYTGWKELLDIPVICTPYIALDSLSADCDLDGKVTVTLDGYNIEDVDLYQEVDGVITKAIDKPFKKGNKTVLKNLTVGKTYKFYANVKDASKVYNKYWWTTEPDYLGDKNIVTEVVSDLCTVYKMSVTVDSKKIKMTAPSYISGASSAYYSGFADIDITVQGRLPNGYYLSFDESLQTDDKNIKLENDIGFDINNISCKLNGNAINISRIINTDEWSSNPGSKEFLGSITVYILIYDSENQSYKNIWSQDITVSLTVPSN